MRFHILGLPHAEVTADYLTCAFTQRVRHFVRMMAPHHEVFLYSGGKTDVEPAEHIQVGRPRHYFPDGFDPVLDRLTWDTSEPMWRDHIDRAKVELSARVEQGDFILATTSANLDAIPVDAAERSITVEWNVGYELVRAPFAFFESYAWMHYVYGMQGTWGRAFDDVIPSAFDTNDYHTGKDGGYLLYLGRMTQGKGVHVASAIADRLDAPIIFAGPGASTPEYEHEIVCEDGTRATGQYLGTLDVSQRALVLSQASALIVPSLYVEPLGSVVIEAMLSGVPVVASDWGAFPELLTPETGRTFRTIREGAQAVLEAQELPRGAIIRHYAGARWGYEVTRVRLERAFERLATLWGEGYYA